MRCMDATSLLLLLTIAPQFRFSSVDQVRIKVEAVGLNFADVFTALGMYDAAPRGQPVVPGLEFSGIVEEVGERISKPKPQVEVERSKDGRR